MLIGDMINVLGKVIDNTKFSKDRVKYNNIVSQYMRGGYTVWFITLEDILFLEEATKGLSRLLD